MKEQLLAAGYEERLIMWSFQPVMSLQNHYWSKNISLTAPDGNADDFEVGVIINPDHNTMEVYICDCTVGCCGESQGTHPFSMQRIQELTDKYTSNYQND